MKQYIVLYRTNEVLPLDPPLGMRFQADDPDHAEEQLLDAEPGADVVWIHEGDQIAAALQEYWN